MSASLPDLSHADPAAALGLVKATVRAQPAYTLATPEPRRKLNQNESPCDVPAALKQEILARVAAAPWHRYPEFTPRGLLDRLARHYGWVPEGILAGNGSNELIQATFSVVLETGDAVVAPSPTFALYRLMTSVLGGRYRPVPLTGPDFAFDVKGIIAAAQREHARLVVLCTPNNPTGTVLPAGALEEILDATRALVVVDEAYLEFGGESALPLLAREPRLVVLRTFSKAMGLAGLRFGVALAHPALAVEIAKAKLPYNVNLVTLAAAAVLLDHYDRCAGMVREVVATRERTRAALAALPGVHVVPSAANFLLLRFSDRNPRELYAQLLERHGILVRDVSATPELQGCLRLSIGSPEDMDATVAALGELLAR